MRLDKFLADCGFGSRKDTKAIIKKGKVLLNGIIVKDPSLHLDPKKDNVILDGKEVVYKKYIYLMLNKPSGVISATKDNFHKTVIDLIPKEFSHYNLFPCGRLDIDTEGLLIITNDGILAHRVLSPSKNVDKKYFVKVLGKLSDDDINSFNKGIYIDNEYITKPAKLEILKSEDISEAYVTIREGKFHQVKKMFLALSKKVIYLKRVEFAGIKLDESLKLGGLRELNNDEIDLILSYRQ